MKRSTAFTVTGLSTARVVELLHGETARVADESGTPREVRLTRPVGLGRASSPEWSTPKRVRAIRADGRVWVLVDGEAFECVVERARERRPGATAADNALRAPMPATVVRVLVQLGQAVTQGAVLVVLEAMKMELSLKAPRSGVVSTLACSPGQLVSPDEVLVVVEPST